LKKGGFSSLPVMDKKTKEYIGVIDYLDIAKHILDVAPLTEELNSGDKKALEMAERAIGFGVVEKVMNKSGIDPFVPISIKNNLSIVLNYFVKGVHRVPIMNHEEKVSIILSQSLLVSHIADNWGYFKKEFDKTLKELSIGQEKPTTINQNEETQNVIKIISEKGLTAVPIVDDNGVLVGNFSASDLKNFHSNSYKLPVMKMSSPEPTFIHQDSKFADVVQLMGKGDKKHKRYHRVWVCDDNKIPVGVVSMTDIMHLALNFSESE
jgi:CBS domain-containing protein